jgi:hypothetical protein
MSPLLRSAVELRLSETRGRLREDLVGAFQFEVLTLHLCHLRAFVRRQASALAAIPLGLVQPRAEHFHGAP